MAGDDMSVKVIREDKINSGRVANNNDKPKVEEPKMFATPENIDSVATADYKLAKAIIGNSNPVGSFVIDKSGNNTTTRYFDSDATTLYDKTENEVTTSYLLRSPDGRPIFVSDRNKNGTIDYMSSSTYSSDHKKTVSYSIELGEGTYINNVTGESTGFEFPEIGF